MSNLVRQKGKNHDTKQENALSLWKEHIMDDNRHARSRNKEKTRRFIVRMALLMLATMGGWLWYVRSVPYPPLERAMPTYTFPHTTITIEHLVDSGFMEISNAVEGKFWKLAVTTTVEKLPSSDPAFENVTHQWLNLVLVNSLNDKEISAEVLGTVSSLVKGGRNIVTLGLIPLHEKNRHRTLADASQCLVVHYARPQRTPGESGWTASRWQRTIPNPFQNNGYSVDLGQATLTVPNEYCLASSAPPASSTGEYRRRSFVLRPYTFVTKQAKMPAE